MLNTTRHLLGVMSTKKKSTLAAKLAEKAKIKPTIAVPAKTEPLEDIEDIATPALRYFSPLQTRQQRKSHTLPESQTSPKRAKRVLESIKVESKPKIANITNLNESKKAIAEQSSQLNQIEQMSEFKDEQKPDLKVAELKSHEVSAQLKFDDDIKSKKWEPINWQQTLDNIRKMRLSETAPVDTMGCHKCADDTADPKTQRFHKLVALMLSSQTKDATTFEAMKRLKAKTLSPNSVTEMPVSVLEALLCPVSFYRNKAKYIKQTSQILVDKYNADIPNNIKELVALPGVGPKMAHICMVTAWNEVTGIGVDVHVHRISNRLKWLPKATKEPEQTRQALEAWLPQELWAEVNHLLVGFGQTVCTPVKPKCEQCLNVLQCPAAAKGAKEKFELKNRVKLSLGIEPL